MGLINIPRMNNGRLTYMQYNWYQWQTRWRWSIPLYVDRRAYPYEIDLTGFSCMIIWVDRDAAVPLTEEASTWIEQEIHRPWTFKDNGYLYFSDETDAVNFKLRWG